MGGERFVGEAATHHGADFTGGGADFTGEDIGRFSRGKIFRGQI